MGMTGGTAAGRKGRWRGNVWSVCGGGGGGGGGGEGIWYEGPSTSTFRGKVVLVLRLSLKYI